MESEAHSLCGAVGFFTPGVVSGHQCEAPEGYFSVPHERGATPGSQSGHRESAVPLRAVRDGAGGPSTEGIDRCPLAPVGETCRLRKHDFRDRKTGPRFGLRILYCSTHQRYFTVYPPGHVPYGRQAVAPIDERGRVAAPEQEAAPWQATLFCCGAGCCCGQALAA